jgi:hypothetical protein
MAAQRYQLQRDATLVRLHRNFSLALRLVNGTDDGHRADRGLGFVACEKGLLLVVS